jgi:peptidoglycan/xylan/chitin deacetylase (PgdA/CDA1 family)
MPPFRADRFATRYLFQPLQRLRIQQSGIPILMYHSISDLDNSTRHPYFRTTTTAEIFKQQVRFLHQTGYRAVNVMEALRLMQARESVEKVVAITFDDGYKDFYTNAFPVLDLYGYSATVFLPTAYIGRTPVKFNGAECLTWNEVRELRKTGVNFGSHTVTHPQLRNISTEQVREEIRQSKDTIEDNLGERIAAFAYPYAFPETDRAFIETLRRTLQESQYRCGVTTTIGRAKQSDNSLFMKRLPVNKHDDIRFFQAKLEGGYDWLRTVQYLAKLTKSRRIGAH